MCYNISVRDIICWVRLAVIVCVYWRGAPFTIWSKLHIELSGMSHWMVEFMDNPI